MELESFMEENMVAFLDEKIARRAPAREREEETGLYEIQKDYAKEVDNALQKNDFGVARSLFEELKSKYAALPKESPMKKTVYSILDEVFEKMRKYVEKREKNKVQMEEGKPGIFEFGGKEIAMPSAPIPVFVTNNPEAKHVEIERADVRKINEEKRKLAIERARMEKEKELMKIEQEKKRINEERKKQGEEKRKIEEEKIKQEEEKRRKEIEEEEEEKEKAEEEKRIENESIKKAIEERRKQREEQFEKLMHEREEKEKQRRLENEKKEKILAKIKEHEAKKEREAEKEKPREMRRVFERDFPEVKHISEKYIEEMYREGIFYLLQKDYDKSKETFQKILKYKPNHLASKIRLEEIENKINPDQNTEQNIEAKKWTQL